MPQTFNTKIGKIKTLKNVLITLTLPILYSDMVQNVVQAQLDESGDSIPKAQIKNIFCCGLISLLSSLAYIIWSLVNDFMLNIIQREEVKTAIKF